MDTENHNDSSNQRDIRNNTVEAMDTEEGKSKSKNAKTIIQTNEPYWHNQDFPSAGLNVLSHQKRMVGFFMCPKCCMKF